MFRFTNRAAVLFSESSSAILIEISYLISVHTKRRGQVVNIPASYSGGPGFKSRLEDGLS
jgi:hypothetical protein